MRILVNALSVTNQSGRYTLMGHMRRIVEWSRKRHEFIFCFHRANSDIVCDLGDHVTWIECPESTAGWVGRAIWERRRLPELIKTYACGAYFTPAGVGVASLGIPQIVYCQNPWCLVDSFGKSIAGRAKAFVQRKAYRQTMKSAEVMVFLSRYMHEAYRRNAGCEAKSAAVVYAGIAEATLTSAEHYSAQVERVPNQIVSVSAMADHKGMETVIEALSILRHRYGIDATLKVIGGWPDVKYRKRIDRLISRFALESRVELCGHVSQEALHRSYAESRIFSLMSTCESFGIPAVEAQTFGTPVVCSNCCAMPEVEGAGGMYPEAGDAGATAEAYHVLLTDDLRWQALSDAARKNAAKYRWDDCARTMLGAFDAVRSVA